MPSFLKRLDESLNPSMPNLKLRFNVNGDDLVITKGDLAPDLPSFVVLCSCFHVNLDIPESKWRFQPCPSMQTVSVKCLRKTRDILLPWIIRREFICRCVKRRRTSVDIPFSVGRNVPLVKRLSSIQNRSFLVRRMFENTTSAMALTERSILAICPNLSEWRVRQYLLLPDWACLGDTAHGLSIVPLHRLGGSTWNKSCNTFQLQRMSLMILGNKENRRWGSF